MKSVSSFLGLALEVSLNGIRYINLRFIYFLIYFHFSQPVLSKPVLDVVIPRKLVHTAATRRILHVAAVWTERSICRPYPESKIAFFLHVFRN